MLKYYWGLLFFSPAFFFFFWWVGGGGVKGALRGGYRILESRGSRELLKRSAFTCICLDVRVINFFFVKFRGPPVSEC